MGDPTPSEAGGDVSTGCFAMNDDCCPSAFSLRSIHLSSYLLNTFGFCHCDPSEAISTIATRLPRRSAPLNDSKWVRHSIRRTYWEVTRPTSGYARKNLPIYSRGKK